MSKLTKEILSAYLPWDVEMISNTDGRGAYISTEKRRLKKIEVLTPNLFELFLFLKRKLILRSLSDLTKEIEHNGERFVPIMRIFGGDNYREYDYRIDVKHRPILGDCINISVVGLGDDIILFGLKHPLNNMLTLESWNLLHEWKFDLYGLIESGYAVNLNEIEK